MATNRLRSLSLGCGLLALLCAAPARGEADTFGLGNGTAPYTGAGGTINSYAPITGTITANSPATTAISIGTVTGADFAVNDLVMLWQPTGLAGNPGWSQTSVSIAGGSVGLWEFARIATRTPTLTLSAPTIYTYAAGRAQMVRVPEYTTVPVPAAGFTAPAWDGAIGGIFVMLASGDVALGGNITVDGKGFRGGVAQDNGAGAGCDPDFGTVAGGFAQKGEGIYFEDYTTATDQGGGKGSIANGGGGGDCYDAGGGGGGLVGLGGAGGNSNATRDVGGRGGCGLLPLDRLLLGGGGGAGASQGTDLSSGGAGGGVIFIRAKSTSGAGNITAHGATAPNLVTDAAGGGGAGGTVVVRLAGPAACGVIAARGGSGGNSSHQGGGGGGSGGHVVVQGEAGTGCTSNITAGAWGMGGQGNGTTNHDGTVGAAGLAERIVGAWCTATVSCTGLTPMICDTNSQTCVECLNSADCKTAGKPVCDQGVHTCRACASSAECGGATPYCETGSVSALKGQCVACTGAKGCTTPPKCDPSTDTCIGCLFHSDCANPTHICDLASHTCRACTATDTCPSDGPKCATTTPFAGWCVECTPTELALCNTTSRPLCDTTGHCAPCDANLGAMGSAPCPTAAEPYCNTSGSLQGTCTECTDNSQCPAQKPKCSKLDGTCNCADDADCGDGMSGKICVAKSCISGCHTPGNGCPADQQCTSTVATPGVCFTPGLDAGPVLIPPDAEIADAELGADVVEIVDAQSPYDAGEQPDVGPGEDAEVPPAEVDAATHVPRYYLGGCGCSAAGSGLPMLALLALALAGPRRRRR